MFDLGFQQISQNSVNEFFEDLTYNVAYSEVLSKINKFFNVENEAVKDALNSATTVFVSSALFLYMQKQEKFLDYIVKIIFSILASFIGYIGLSKIKNKIKGKFGRRLKNIMNFFNNSETNNINSARLVVETGSYVSNNVSNYNSYVNRLNPAIFDKGNLISTQTHKLNYARAKVQSINETLLFKLFTSKFTPKDKEFIRRMCGGAGDVDIDKLNKVAEFMYVTDDSGEITGISEQFLTMLNGFGYYKGKEKGKNSGK